MRTCIIPNKTSYLQRILSFITIMLLQLLLLITTLPITNNNLAIQILYTTCMQLYNIIMQLSQESLHDKFQISTPHKKKVAFIIYRRFPSLTHQRIFYSHYITTQIIILLPIHLGIVGTQCGSLVNANRASLLCDCRKRTAREPVCTQLNTYLLVDCHRLMTRHPKSHKSKCLR